MTSTQTRRRTRTARAPYQVGDHVSAAYRDPEHGTCLARAARVIAVRRTDDRPDHPWTITYRISENLTREIRVNADGIDGGWYVAPSTSVLSADQANTPAGQAATALAATLRRARVPGPLATTTTDGTFAVVVTHPSGRDQVVISIEATGSAPVFQIAAYEDHEHQPPAHEHTAHSIPAAVTEVVRLLAIYQRTEPNHTSEPPFEVVGDRVTVRVDAAPVLVGIVTASGPWGIEVEPAPGAARHRLAWDAPRHTYLFQQQP